MKKIWINEHDFFEFEETAAMPVMTGEIATRSSYSGLDDLFGSLPDPDPVLKSMGLDLSVYRQLLTDAHVWACYTSRKAGTKSKQWEVTEAAEGGARAANTKALDLANDIMRRLNVRQIISDMTDAPFFGISPVEVMWENSSGQWLPEKAVGKPPEWFTFDRDNSLRFRSQNNAFEGEEIPPAKIILCSHNATYLNPYGERLLSRCFWPVTFKKGGFKFWAVFVEKFGMPWVHGKVPRSTSDPERRKLLSNLSSMVQDAVAVINNDENIEITEAGGKKASGDIYQGLISAANREVSKAVLGQTLTTELDNGGSYAATQGHLDIREDIVDDDADMVCAGFNRLFAWVTELNVPNAAPPVFSFVQEEDIQKDRAERDTNLSTQIRFTKKYYMRTYNLEDDDFEVVGESGKPDDTKEFAENPEPDTVETFADKTEADAAGLLDGMIEPIRELLETADSLEAIRDGLIDLYPDMDTKDLGTLMQRTFAAAAMAGRYEAGEE